MTIEANKLYLVHAKYKNLVDFRRHQCFSKYTWSKYTWKEILLLLSSYIFSAEMRRKKISVRIIFQIVKVLNNIFNDIKF